MSIPFKIINLFKGGKAAHSSVVFLGKGLSVFIFTTILSPKGWHLNRGGFPRGHLAAAYGQKRSQPVPPQQVAQITVDLFWCG